jgi:hypothetical protein
VKYVFLCFLMLGGFGCSNSDRPSDGGTYRVRIPLPDDSGNYKLQTVNLQTVTDIDSMTGSVSQIRYGGKIESGVNEQGYEGEYIDSEGNRPAAHFLNSDGVLIPTDFNSLVMTTNMYQFEKIKGFYDQFGTNASLTFPRHVLMNAYEIENDGVQSYKGMDNASYLAGFDVFVILPYNFAGIPLSMNGGILAHEWLHSLFFQKLGFKKIEFLSNHETIANFDDSPSSLKVADGPKQVLADKQIGVGNDFVMASIDEGVADFFGFLYTNQSDFFKGSIPGNINSVIHHFDRDLKSMKVSPFKIGDGAEENFIYYNVIRHDGEPKGYDPHDLGSTFAHLLYVMAQEWGNSFSGEQLLSFIDQYTMSYKKNRALHYISFEEILPFLFTNKPANENLCKEMQKIYPGQVQGVKECAQWL